MTSKLQKKPSALKTEHPALHNMKFLDFFQFLWVIFCTPRSRSGFRIRIDWIRNTAFTTDEPQDREVMGGRRGHEGELEVTLVTSLAFLLWN
jgi:hypothetical protein